MLMEINSKKDILRDKLLVLEVDVGLGDGGFFGEGLSVLKLLRVNFCDLMFFKLLLIFFWENVEVLDNLGVLDFVRRVIW